MNRRSMSLFVLTCLVASGKALATEATPNMAEVLRDTHEFYEAAWSRLAWFLGIGGGLLIVVVPALLIVTQILIERGRRAMIRREINDAVERGKQLSVKEISPKLEKLANEVESTRREVREAADDMVKHGRGVSMVQGHLMTSMGASLLLMGKFPEERASFFCRAAHFYRLGQAGDDIIADSLNRAADALCEATGQGEGAPVDPDLMAAVKLATEEFRQESGLSLQAEEALARLLAQRATLEQQHEGRKGNAGAPEANREREVTPGGDDGRAG